MSFGNTCLADPSSFPEDFSGEPWGTEDLLFDLPGGPYYFLGLSSGQARSLENLFGSCCSSAAVAATAEAPGVTTMVLGADRDRFLAFDRVDWKILIDVDYRPRGLRLAAHQWMGSVDWNQGHRGAIWTPVAEGRAFTDLFENYFRILVAYRLLHLGGLLLHSAGVVTPGAAGSSAYVFPGQSGNGKSTLSKLSAREGRTVLSDDGNAVLPAPEGGFVVQALPFGGEMRNRELPTGHHPLGRLVALAKGNPNRLETLGKAEATGLLLACSPFVNGDPFQLSNLMATIESLLAAVPSRRLTFTREGGFWGLLEADELTVAEVEEAR